MITFNGLNPYQNLNTRQTSLKNTQKNAAATSLTPAKQVAFGNRATEVFDNVKFAHVLEKMGSSKDLTIASAKSTLRFSLTNEKFPKKYLFEFNGGDYPFIAYIPVRQGLLSPKKYSITNPLFITDEDKLQKFAHPDLTVLNPYGLHPVKMNMYDAIENANSFIRYLLNPEEYGVKRIIAKPKLNLVQTQ